MSNLIETIPFIGVRGDVLIETRDAKSGKLAQRNEGHNLFTNYGLERFRKYCAAAIGCQFGANKYFDEGSADEANSTYGLNGDFGLMKYLYLTDNENAITADMAQIPGTVTGFATRTPYTGTDTSRGEINMNECVFTRDKLKAVFDFATDKANGVHKSVLWADRAFNLYNAYGSIEDSGLEASFVRGYTNVAESSDGYFYGFVGTTLYKIDPTTLSEIATYTLPASPATQSVFDVTGGYCYFTINATSATLYIFKLSDSTNTTITLPIASSLYGGAVVDGYLYYPSASRIYKVNVSTAASEYKTITISANYVHRSGNQLYLHAEGNSIIYSYDYAANTATDTLCKSPGSGNLYCNSYSLTNKLWYKRSTTCYYNGSTNGAINTLYKFNPAKPAANMITGRVLDTPIEKLNTQTMKVTYTISFT